MNNIALATIPMAPIFVNVPKDHLLHHIVSNGFVLELLLPVVLIHFTLTSSIAAVPSFVAHGLSCSPSMV
jgi:hypothetical protein